MGQKWSMIVFARHLRQVDVVGPPNSGKTTLLKAIHCHYGIDPADVVSYRDQIWCTLATTVYQVGVHKGLKSPEWDQFKARYQIGTIPPLDVLHSVRAICVQIQEETDDDYFDLFEKFSPGITKYLTKLAIICRDNYEPTHDDILSFQGAKIKSVSAVIDQVPFKFCDRGFPPSTFFPSARREFVVFCINSLAIKTGYSYSFSMLEAVLGHKTYKKSLVGIIFTKIDLLLNARDTLHTYFETDSAEIVKGAITQQVQDQFDDDRIIHIGFVNSMDPSTVNVALQMVIQHVGEN
uniref:G domain-containing protein n=1 Tax=Panagrellus redivivus TaxID=6233 RepID=A0A7E4V793_PANRE